MLHIYIYNIAYLPKESAAFRLWRVPPLYSFIFPFIDKYEQIRRKLYTVTNEILNANFDFGNKEVL